MQGSSICNLNSKKDDCKGISVSISNNLHDNEDENHKKNQNLYFIAVDKSMISLKILTILWVSTYCKISNITLRFVYFHKSY